MSHTNETQIEDIFRQAEAAQNESFGLIHEESGIADATDLAFSGLFEATATAMKWPHAALVFFIMLKDVYTRYTGPRQGIPFLPHLAVAPPPMDGKRQMDGVPVMPQALSPRHSGTKGLWDHGS